MLKHCQATAADHNRRSRRTSLNSSLNSSLEQSFDSRRSSFSSGESPPTRSSTLLRGSPMSLASSLSSLQQHSSGEARTPIKVFAKCLRPDIEYKTLSARPQTSCRELIWQLLSKFKMRHRDPNLFYLTMDVGGGGAASSSLPLDDDACPAQLQSCHPWRGECKFTLQMRKGTLVRVYDSLLMSGSKYKSLLVAEHTTAAEVVSVLLHCYGLERVERADRFCLVERVTSANNQHCYERRLHPADRPAQVQSLWPGGQQFHFVLKHCEVSGAGGFSSAGVSPVGSDVEDTASSSSSSSSSSSPSPKFRLSGLVTRKAAFAPSLHECGLPSATAASPVRPPPPQQAPKSLMLLGGNFRTSLASSTCSSTSLHDYENYFYI